MKKGCLIAFGSLAALSALAIGVMYFMAYLYEKRPKGPGEAELNAAKKFVVRYDDIVAEGNTPEAKKYAESYSHTLQALNKAFTTGRNNGTNSNAGEHITTYCFHSEDSIALIVHVPELRRYTNKAQHNLAELAWRQATYQAAREFPDVKRLAIGMCGFLDYSAIITGEINAHDPPAGIKQHHPVTSYKSLWPYFTAKEDKINGEQAAPRNR